METRSQAISRFAAEREMEDAITKVNDEFNARFAEMDERLTSGIAQVFEALKLIPGYGASTSQATSGNDSQQTNLDGNRFRSPHYSRMSKIDFPRFNGDRVKDWLFKVEQFFLIDNTAEDLKVSLVSIHLDDQAASWHQSVIQTEAGSVLNSNWTGYKALLLERFAEILDDPFADLKNLQESEGIVEYHSRFEQIRNRLNLSEDYLVSAYLAGLKNDTQMHIRMFQPTTIRQCFLLGKLYETAHPKRSFSASNPSKTSSILGAKPWESRWSQGAKKDVVLELHQGAKKDVVLEPANSVLKGKEVQGAPRKFLTNKEMSERRAKGLCYYCDEKYTPEHFLQHKKNQLFMLEIEDDMVSSNEDSYSDTEDDKVQISVNAVAGISDFRTMRVRGMYGKKTLFVLIDSGSTHNFLDKSMAERLGCKLQPMGLTKVAVADGSTIRVSAKVEQFSWQFHNSEFRSDMMVIPLGCCDVVLGVQWLSTLGPIKWNFSDLTMRFKVNNKKVTLNGITPGSVRDIRAKQVNRKYAANVQLAMIYGEVEPQPVDVSVFSVQPERSPHSPALQSLLHQLFDKMSQQDLEVFRPSKATFASNLLGLEIAFADTSVGYDSLVVCLHNTLVDGVLMHNSRDSYEFSFTGVCGCVQFDPGGLNSVELLVHLCGFEVFVERLHSNVFSHTGVSGIPWDPGGNLVLVLHMVVLLSSVCVSRVHYLAKSVAFSRCGSWLILPIAELAVSVQGTR